MIIHLESATAENVEAAKRSLDAIAHSWGHEIAEIPAEATAAAATSHRDDEKVVDPVSAAALVLSLPSAALPVLAASPPAVPLLPLTHRWWGGADLLQPW